MKLRGGVERERERERERKREREKKRGTEKERGEREMAFVDIICYNTITTQKKK